MCEAGSCGFVCASIRSVHAWERVCVYACVCVKTFHVCVCVYACVSVTTLHVCECVYV